MNRRNPDGSRADTMRTENLVILFTDIAGFTEASSQQSREQNQRILDRHNALLLPIVKRFGGRHIKSIGDALLLVFTSPTDGMRCAMAMQDALHEYNLSAPKDEEIHVRIAASLGEVRVTKGDIFGEPVNVTSRIEGITPGDEIYFSEAVYLAMNKAEVPAVEIGVHELKGISKPVRIFAIPRFAETRLVADVNAASPADPHIGYPFGGMHLSGSAVANQWTMGAESIKSKMKVSSKAWIGAGCVGVALLAALWLWDLRHARKVESTTVALLEQPALPAAAPALTPPLVTTAQNVSTLVTTPPAAAVPPTSPDPAQAAIAAKPKAPALMNVAQAKAAYRAARINRERYRDIVTTLEAEYDMYVRRAKIDYKEGRISKESFRLRVASLKRRYYGEY